jgi:hypothetical protein
MRGGTTMTPEEFFASYSPEVEARARQLRTLVKTVFPDMQEIVFAGYKNVSYGTGTSRTDKDLICYIAPFTHSVNLGFYRGATLPDPHGLLEGTGKLLRHVKCTPATPLDEAALTELLRAARTERLGDA